MPRIEDISIFNAVREAGMQKLVPAAVRIAVGMGTCGRGNGAEGVYQSFADFVQARGTAVKLVATGCFGACFQEPLVNVRIPGQPLLILSKVKADDCERILHELVEARAPAEHVFCKVEEWDHITTKIFYGRGYPEIPSWDAVPFFKGQKKLVLRNCGIINPDDIEEYIAVGGYQALYKVLIDGRPANVIEQIKASKLRGRGGAGFLTGNKWEFMTKAVADHKYIICNADEGDPGAYMNRNEIESDPHALLEGMIIGGYVMGATEGIVYVRAEYPLAVHRLRRALEQAREYGILGNNILGRGFKFDISLVEGAGAFVCGEETALIASLEGMAGRPRPRPPFPAQKGLWGKPTNINNVETWYNIAPIITKGPAWFTETGSAKSAGTKVFSLVGKVNNTGLVEMPLGTPLKTFVYDVGEGGPAGRHVKAVQTGGPSGGCIPVDMLDTPVDYESLAQLGSIMGSGGMVVMDEDNCMVDHGRQHRVWRCLAQPAKRHFRQEFEDHIVAHRCRAGVCQELAVSPCENSCPLHMNIPRFLQLFKENRLDDAFESVLMDNPLPASTGRVCQHPCDARCRRQTLDESVNMREVHRYIADAILLSDRYETMVERIRAKKLEATGRKIAIAGAGPTVLETVARHEAVQIGKKIAIIGGGNAAIDSARTVMRMGSEALVLYRRERKDMPAIEEETEAAKAEGAKLMFLAAPHRIIGGADGRVNAIEVVKTRLGEYDTSGRRKPVLTDEIQRIPCDGVILAVGETFDKDFARASGLEIKESGTIVVDRLSLATSRERFYAGGDVITGASNVSNAMAYGKEAARNIDERLSGTQRWLQLFPQLQYEQDAPEEVSTSRRHHASAAPAGIRVKSEMEVVHGLQADEAHDEACRCLRCDVKVVATVS